MGWFGDKGITAHLYYPGFVAGVWTPKGAHAASINDVESYNHVIDTEIGFASCSLSFKITDTEINQWLQSGMARHIEVWDDAENIIWEGFVGSLSITYGPLQINRGDMMDIVNRGTVAYQVLDTSTRPPHAGEKKRTAIINNTVSQANYGICSGVLSGGAITDIAATQLVNSWTTERAEPSMEHAVSLGSNAPVPVIQLSCYGYGRRLNYSYNYTATAAVGTIDLSVKLANVLDADPNGIFSSTNADIESNVMQVWAYENEDRLAINIVNELTAYGTFATWERQLFEVGVGRRVKFYTAPSSIDYHFRVTQNRQRVTTPNGAPVELWRVHPGRWLLFPDLLPGMVPTNEYAINPRAMFIEQVTFTSPDSLQFSGGQQYSTQRVLARRGLRVG